MKSISIDLETWGGVEISKSGVYRYAEAEDFAILLFGYSALTCRCWACTWTGRAENDGGQGTHPLFFNSSVP